MISSSVADKDDVSGVFSTGNPPLVDSATRVFTFMDPPIEYTVTVNLSSGGVTIGMFDVVAIKA